MTAASALPRTSRVIRTEAQLRTLIGEPAQLTRAKISDRLHAMTHQFVVPRVTDTFRVSGRATITTDRELLAACAVEGKVPLLGVLVDIDEAYTQCSKALLRSQLRDPQRFIDPGTMPTAGQVHRAIQGEAFDAQQYDEERAERYRRRVGFY